MDTSSALNRIPDKITGLYTKIITGATPEDADTAIDEFYDQMAQDAAGFLPVETTVTQSGKNTVVVVTYMLKKPA